MLWNTAHHVLDEDHSAQNMCVLDEDHSAQNMYVLDEDYSATEHVRFG
jgi:hypothetical protein